MTEPTTPQALLAAGSTITLADGQTATVRYDFLAIYHVEEAYGSLQALLDLAKKIDGATAASSPMLGVVLDLVRFGLVLPGQNQTPDAPLTRVDAARRLDLTRIAEYVEAAGRAISEAFGPTPPPSSGDNTGSRPDPTPPSSGSNTGGSPSPTDSPASSGT